MPGMLPRLLTALLLAFPGALFALGLGDIRLKSALNEPLDAEIDLVSATPDELSSLRAALASRETFVRYGLERPQFLSELDFRVGRSTDGRNVLFVRSRESVTDPFLTFLVEVNWSRGRLLREYTVLMDPPIYTPGEAVAGAPVAAPQAGESTASRSGAVERPTESAPQAAPSPSVSRAAPISVDGSSYTVRRNDTLWQIASGLRPGPSSDVNRMMLALFRANPEAFRGNINHLHAGAILRIPDTGEFESIAVAEARSEVQRQYAEWRTSRGVSGAQPGAESARLRLVTPTEGGEGAAATTPDSGDSQALRDRVTQLEGQLAESRRLLEVRDAELARLQQQLGQAPAVTPPVPGEEPEAAVPLEAPSAETPEETAPVAEPEATAPSEEPAAEPEPAVTVEEPPEPDLLAWAMANWYIPIGALLILIAILYGLVWRRRQEPDFGALGRLAAAAEPVSRGTRIEREPVTSPVRAPKPRDEDTFLVEETAQRAQPRSTRAEPRVEKPKAETRARGADDTLSSETAINFDQGDPLAEADFHMAYGLYDQAADLVRIAIEREPQRRDLKLKLLEIFFVWGNKDSFLQTGRQLHESRSLAAAGEWDKIAIMGRQIAPDDPLFTAAPGGGGGGEVDLNLEGGENRVDLDLLGTPEGEQAGGIDLDLGGVFADEDTASTSELRSRQAEEGLDFELGEATDASDNSATTREMPSRTMETPTVEMSAYGGTEAPTVETTGLRDRSSSTVKEKIDTALFRKDPASPDQTAELALDDLGLDLDALRDAESGPLDSLEETDHPPDAATMVAGMDEKSRRLMSEADKRGREAKESYERAEQSPTGTWVLDDKTLAATVALPGASGDMTPTDRVRALEGTNADTARRRKPDADSTAELANLSEEEMDLDLDRLEQALKTDTAKQPRKGASDEDRFSSDVFTGSRGFEGGNLDVDVGDVRHDRDRTPTGTARIPADEMALPELEPVTMSEVGTKLDLARAYMDMGDPEGARSILEEVLHEGSATQKQEAQRLIDSLPG